MDDNEYIAKRFAVCGHGKLQIHKLELTDDHLATLQTALELAISHRVLSLHFIPMDGFEVACDIDDFQFLKEHLQDQTR